MAVKEILVIGNPILRKKSDDVIEFNNELRNTIVDLRDTLIDFQKRKTIGRAIAAPQIGVLKKIIYWNLPDRTHALVNPEIIWKSDETFEVWDSCFSFDVAFFVKTKRNKSIKVKYQTESGVILEETFTDDYSELLQHEIDHLHGILATDRQISKNDIVMRTEWEKHYK